MAEVQLHAGLEAPLQRHVVDGDRRLLAAQRVVHRRVEVVGRVQVGAVVGGQVDQLHRPAFAVRKVFLLQAREERFDLLEGVLVREVLDLGRERRRVGQDVVLQEDRQVDEFAGHGKGSCRVSEGRAEWLSSWGRGRAFRDSR
jgi:hypothetical protein